MTESIKVGIEKHPQINPNHPWFIVLYDSRYVDWGEDKRARAIVKNSDPEGYPFGYIDGHGSKTKYETRDLATDIYREPRYEVHCPKSNSAATNEIVLIRSTFNLIKSRKQ